MKRKEIEKLGLNTDDTDLDLISIAESHFFNQRSIKDYRNKAMDFCIENKKSFHNTENNSFEMMRKFIKIVCPICEENIEKNVSAHGNGNSHTNRVYCEKCGVTATITIPTNGLTFGFEE